MWHACPAPARDGGRRVEAFRHAWSSFVPAAACISLQEREDRATAAAAEFARVGLDHLVQFYRPKRDRSTHVKRPGVRGCWQSHRVVARWALRKGYSHVLVLEDDATFVEDFASGDLAQIRRCFNALPPNWRVLFLGHAPFVTVPVLGTPGLVRAYSLCLHAYIMSRDFMRWLVAHPYDLTMDEATRAPFLPLRYYAHRTGIGIDVYVAAMRGCYAVRPMLCFQRDSASDNPKIPLLASVLGGLGQPTLLRTMERLSVLWLPIVIVIGAAAIVLLFVRKRARRRSNAAAAQ